MYMAIKIEDYIKDAKKLGLSKEQVKASLEKQGWRLPEINEALDKAYPYTGDSIVSEKRDIPEGEISGLALAGLILAFIFPLLGLIFSILALNKIKNNKNLRGTTLAILGVVFSISITILATLAILDGTGIIAIGFAQKLGIDPSTENIVEEEIIEEPIIVEEETKIMEDVIEEPQELEDTAQKRTVQQKIEDTITYEEWGDCGIKGILKCEKHELDRLGNLILSFQNLAGDDIYVMGMKVTKAFNATTNLNCYTQKRVLIGKAIVEEFELKCEDVPSNPQTLNLDLEVEYTYQMEQFIGKGNVPVEII